MQIPPIASELWADILTALNYPLTVVDGNRITSGKIIGAVFLFVLGLAASRALVLLLEKRLLLRLKVDRGGRAAIKALSYYSFLVIFAFFALKVAGIPLSLFTFVGGALAIGIGFGSQNLVNNFISGLILLVERPIRVGDLVEVLNIQGRVIRIGPRSTIIRTGQSADVVFPNSTFLEKELVNWTLSDENIRCGVAVGVSYGSDPTLVKSLLLRAVRSNARILGTPEPLALFTDFGPNALQFQIFFWITVERLIDRSTIESEIRQEIYKLFNEHSLIIPFTQANLQLETKDPIQVQFTRAAANAAKQR